MLGLFYSAFPAAAGNIEIFGIINTKNTTYYRYFLGKYYRSLDIYLVLIPIAIDYRLMEC